MKILSNLFFALSVIFVGLWAFLYTYVMSLACAFGSPNSNKCNIKMPWTLHGEDLSFLIGTPAIILTLMLVLAFYFRKVARKTTPSE